MLVWHPVLVTLVRYVEAILLGLCHADRSVPSRHHPWSFRLRLYQLSWDPPSEMAPSELDPSRLV